MRKTWGVAVALLLLAGCDATGKAAQPFDDAQVAGHNTGKADVINMPDGFSNVATKCDHGNRIYVVYHGDSTYGSITVVAKDPTCGG
jgi:hypothetical protein